MIRKASFLEIAGAVLATLRANTKFAWYDAIPMDAPTPLGMVEVVGKTDSSAKTTIKETFAVNLHVIAPVSDSRVPIYRLIQQTEEAMTDPLILPEPIRWIRSAEEGVTSVQLDETGEYHAVLQYSVMVSYGLRVKGIMQCVQSGSEDTATDEGADDGTE